MKRWLGWLLAVGLATSIEMMANDHKAIVTLVATCALLVELARALAEASSPRCYAKLARDIIFASHARLFFATLQQHYNVALQCVLAAVLLLYVWSEASCLYTSTLADARRLWFTPKPAGAVVSAPLVASTNNVTLTERLALAYALVFCAAWSASVYYAAPLTGLNELLVHTTLGKGACVVASVLSASVVTRVAAAYLFG